MKPAVAVTFALLAAGVLNACTQTSKPEPLAGPATTFDYARFIDELPGDYSNARQYAAADEALKITPQIGETRPWIDLQYAMFRRVSVPAVPGDVIALEWRNGSPDGAVSRQRFWAFRQSDGHVLMDFYGFRSPVDMTDSAALAALSLDDLIGYPAGCSLPVELGAPVVRFAIPSTCRITSQTGREMMLASETLFDGTLRYKESGWLVDGTPVFEVPGGLAYVFERAAVSGTASPASGY